MKKRKEVKIVAISVYRDTIEKHNEDINMAEIYVTEEFSRKYWNKFQKDNYETYEEFINNYICDDTEDFYNYAKENDAIIQIWYCTYSNLSRVYGK